MQGFRTVLAALALLVTGAGGAQLAGTSPETQAWVTMLSLAYAVVMIVMRMFTSTPLGKKIEDNITKKLGINETAVDAQLVKAAPTADIKTLEDRIAALEAASKKLETNP